MRKIFCGVIGVLLFAGVVYGGEDQKVVELKARAFDLTIQIEQLISQREIVFKQIIELMKQKKEAGEKKPKEDKKK